VRLMASIPPVTQPPFSDNIANKLGFPLTGMQFGNLKRGKMVWDKPITGFSGNAEVKFLYNPSTVSATYYMATPGVGDILLYPNANDTSDLRVPLNQSVSFSLLYDRTFELWGAYGSDGTSNNVTNPGTDTNNNPSIVGVMADIYQMQQFTGMTVSYNSSGQVTTSTSPTDLAGRQGIMQLIPSYVFFGNTNVLAYYGYITEWDVTVTHWTQYMVPMRCVIDVTFNMLPPKNNQVTITGAPSPSTGGGINIGAPGSPPVVVPVGPTSNSSRGGR
jgi:hypothetical protein